MNSWPGLRKERQRLIVVGVDGSAESLNALRFAAGEAAIRDTGVQAAFAVEPPSVPWLGYEELTATVLEETAALLSGWVTEAFSGEHPAGIQQTIVAEAPTPALLASSAEAQLLVVGSRGRGGFSSLVFGSVSHQCALHARCPVAIVGRRANPAHKPADKVVVGVDGSDESKEALRWANEEAGLRGALLQVISAWQVRAFPPAGVSALDTGRDALRLVRGITREVLGPGRAEEIETLAIEGAAARTLLEVAEAADLLVVGARGRGGFPGLLLGSVSHQCAAYADCPVVIVRDRDRIQA